MRRVTLVIRGADLLPSTGQQMRLARMLGCSNVPSYLHHPLLCDPAGRKLSKSHGDAGVRELRQAGRAPEEVIGRAAAAIGLLPAPLPLAAGQVHELFDRDAESAGRRAAPARPSDPGFQT